MIPKTMSSKSNFDQIEAVTYVFLFFLSMNFSEFSLEHEPQFKFNVHFHDFFRDFRPF